MQLREKVQLSGEDIVERVGIVEREGIVERKGIVE